MTITELEYRQMIEREKEVANRVKSLFGKNKPNERDCEHGQLSRSCEICGYLNDIADLNSQIDELIVALKYHQEQTRPIQQTMDILAKYEAQS